MAFDAHILMIDGQTGPEVEEQVYRALQEVLSTFRLRVEKEVSLKEYFSNTTSQETSHYLRVVKKKKDGEETQGAVSYSGAKYESDVFANSRYGMLSTSRLEGNTVAWISTNQKLAHYIPGFESFTFAIGQLLSARYNYRVYVLYATSMSRNDDRFSLFIRGKDRNPLSGKGALTTVKNTYGIDINHLMDNVDTNLAIHFAPVDVREAKKQMDEQEKRYDEFVRELKDKEILDKTDGSNMVEVFLLCGNAMPGCGRH